MQKFLHIPMPSPVVTTHTTTSYWLQPHSLR